MKKIISLFKRDYDNSRKVYNEVVPGAEWVLAGEGVPTVKYDGTACMISSKRLWKRYDRKLTKEVYKKKKKGFAGPWKIEDFKPAPEGWEAAEESPDVYTGHWPGWLPVGSGPEDKYHREALEVMSNLVLSREALLCIGGTYELVGPKVQGNPYGLACHVLLRHGSDVLCDVPRDFDGLRSWLEEHNVEGVVWHHPDGRMVKLKRKDFGFVWPVSVEAAAEAVKEVYDEWLWQAY